MSSVRTWQIWSQHRQQRLQHLIELKEFQLTVSHPQIFVSYRAAKSWAVTMLSDMYASRPRPDDHDWIIQMTKQGDHQFCCSISEASWRSDHAGLTRPTAALAVIQAVLEMQVGF